ncbi:MAG TPA: alpha-amylase family glycosyl hydrolase [Streptosporangiaceae bacterium]|nr:alpha-amylase family glycosyl hydrolase [Streptosporangiaceae bacterium]
MAAGRWWQGAVLYQVYVRSFQDSDGDGYGDLRGIIGRLDYLRWLGVDGIWLSPTMPSPDQDWGYDVSDYRGVHPDFGTLADLDELIAEAARLDIRVLLDLVPNHTSSAHPWFADALTGRSSKHRDYYVWADPGPSGGPPNNWLDATGDSAWQWDEPSGQYYLHNFLSAQPDLNWWQPAVHEEFRQIIEYWFDRGVAGFRIDVAHGLYKDAALRDDPPATTSGPLAGRFGYRQVYSANRPQTHGVYRQWRSLAERYSPPRLLLGETWMGDFGALAAFYGDDDELQLAFNFPFVYADFTAAGLSATLASTMAALPAGACPVWTASNHDVGRFPSRWCGGDPVRVRLAHLLLATLPGAVVLYYGDEIGMTDVIVPPELQRDPMSARRPPEDSRDRGRTPMQWDGSAGGGFTADGAAATPPRSPQHPRSPQQTRPPQSPRSPRAPQQPRPPWLPLGDAAACNVADQRDDPGSVLRYCRELIRLRKAEVGADLRCRLQPAPDGVLSYAAGRLAVAANLTGSPVELPGVVSSDVLISSLPPAAGAASGAAAWAPSGPPPSGSSPPPGQSLSGPPTETGTGSVVLAPWEGIAFRPVQGTHVGPA